MRTTGRGQAPVLLLDVVDVLRARQIDYAVIGAVAASVHGKVRASQDADVLLSAAALDGPRIQTAFKDAGFQTTLQRGDLEDDIPSLLRLQDSFGNQVDLLLGLRRLDPKAFSRTIEVPLQGVPLRFIGREDFIAMKLYAGGPVDLQDAQNAIEARTDTLDLQLVRSLAARFGQSASARLESVLRKALGAGHEPSTGAAKNRGLDDDLE